MSNARFNIIVLCIILGTFLVGCQNDSNPTGCRCINPDLAEKLQTSLDNAIQEFKIPGAIMAVRTPQGATWIGASGFANREDGTPMTPDTYSRIGSVTKTYTATVILQLVDEVIHGEMPDG